MKKVFLINALADGGAERAVLTLCDGFVRQGDEVHLILVYRAYAYEVPDGVMVHYLFDNRPKGKMQKIFLLPIAVKKLKEILVNIEKNSTIDLFTSHLQLSNYIAWLSKIKKHYGVIHSTYSKKYTGVMKILVLLTLKNKRIVTVSEGVKDDLVLNFSLNKNNVMAIYNPLDISLIRERSNEELKYKKPYIVHVGRLSKVKRHDLLINAYNHSSIKDNYDLLFLGDGEDRSAIELQIKKLGLEKQIKLLGWQSNPYKWIRNASLFVLCSEYEGLSIVIIESLICNTPVVSTNCKSGPSEILVKELAEYLVPVNDVMALSNKIESALQYYPKIDSEYYEKFDIDNIVNKYKTLGE